MSEEYLQIGSFLLFLVIGYAMGRGIGGDVIRKITVKPVQEAARRFEQEESEVWQYKDQDEKDATIALFLDQVRRDPRTPLPEGLTEEDVLDFQRRYEGREQ